MKKVTPKSIGVWAVAATIAQAQRLITGVAIVLLVVSMSLMRDAPPRALLPSASNNAQRNMLNIANFAVALCGALAFMYLAGLFGHPLVGSVSFWIACGGLAAAVLFQAGFAMATCND